MHLLMMSTLSRAYIKDLEKIRPSSILDLIHSGETLSVSASARARMPAKRACARCGYVSSMEVCKACVMLVRTGQFLANLKL